MILLVDLGNTRLKWTALDGRELSPGQAKLHRGNNLGELLTEQWGPLAEVPERLYVASVAGALADRALAGWVAERWDVPMDFVRTAAQGFGVHNGYREPLRLGVDRWMALIAARNRVAGAVCIGDFGTAVTIDGLAPDGSHLGGCIVPGSATMASLLATSTAGVSVAGSPQRPIPSGLFATDTAGGVTAAANHCAAALLERALEQLASQYPEVTCLITGGDGAQMCDLLPQRCIWVPDLVLEGLRLVATEVDR